VDLELRDITDEEFPAHARLTEAAFGHQPSDEEVRIWADLTAGEHRWGVFDDGEIVATGGAFAFDLTVPGGATVPAGGLTAIAVRPTHRRRGILTAMMDHHLDEVARRRQPVSVLTASEAAIYGRFGYGPAAHLITWTLPTTGASLTPPPRAEGRLRVVDATTARTVLPEVYDAHRAVTPGALSRGPARWDHLMLDREASRDGASALFHVVHESTAGVADGYAAYRLKPSWTSHGIADGELVALAVVSADPEVEAALWAHLLGIDLVTRVTGSHRPVEDPLRWRLTDPRRMQVQHVLDHLWVRILDVPAALEARRYPVAGSVVIEVADAFRPANSGRYRLEGGPASATCARTGEPADVALAAPDLGSLYLGGVRASTLARAGRVEERTPGALARLDVMLSWDRSPWCATDF
jgi:predicted acetyltransferase